MTNGPIAHVAHRRQSRIDTKGVEKRNGALPGGAAIMVAMLLTLLVALVANAPPPDVPARGSTVTVTARATILRGARVGGGGAGQPVFSAPEGITPRLRDTTCPPDHQPSCRIIVYDLP